MKTIFSSSAMLIAPLLMVCGGAAQADQWDKYTTIKVNQAIEVPGTVLPAGKYVFKLVDSPANRHVVQVFDKNQSHVMATVMAVPNYRLEPTGDTALSFYEVAAGQPQPVKAWFYPGDNYGQEFIYPKERLDQLARNTTTTTTAPAPALQPAPEPQPNIAANQPAEPSPEATPEPAPAPAPQVAANEPPPAPAPQPAAPVMPQTASYVPMLALAGLLSIGIAAGLSVLTKRMN